MSTIRLEASREISRDLGSVLSGAEKRLLVWMARRIPEAVSPDHLTLLGLLGMMGAGLSFRAARTEPIALAGVVAFLFLNWLGDSLDGTVARVRGRERPKYGYYVDHVTDLFGALFLLGGLALSGFMSPPVAGGLMIAYLMVVAEIYLAAHSVGTFRIHFLRLGPTELRILLAGGTLYLLHDPYATFLGARHLLFDLGGIAAILGLAVTLLVSVARNVRILHLRETIR